MGTASLARVLNPRAWDAREKAKALKARVMDMNEISLRLALMMVAEGADVDYAIDAACRAKDQVTSQRRET